MLLAGYVWNEDLDDSERAAVLRAAFKDMEAELVESYSKMEWECLPKDFYDPLTDFSWAMILDRPIEPPL